MGGWSLNGAGVGVLGVGHRSGGKRHWLEKELVETEKSGRSGGIGVARDGGRAGGGAAMGGSKVGNGGGGRRRGGGEGMLVGGVSRTRKRRAPTRR